MRGGRKGQSINPDTVYLGCAASLFLRFPLKIFAPRFLKSHARFVNSHSVKVDMRPSPSPRITVLSVHTVSRAVRRPVASEVAQDLYPDSRTFRCRVNDRLRRTLLGSTFRATVESTRRRDRPFTQRY